MKKRYIEADISIVCIKDVIITSGGPDRGTGPVDL